MESNTHCGTRYASITTAAQEDRLFCSAKTQFSLGKITVGDERTRSRPASMSLTFGVLRPAAYLVQLRSRTSRDADTLRRYPWSTLSTVLPCTRTHSGYAYFGGTGIFFPTHHTQRLDTLTRPVAFPCQLSKHFRQTSWNQTHTAVPATPPLQQRLRKTDYFVRLRRSFRLVR